MNVELFLKGIIVGLSVSAPFGPMAMMVVQKCLNRGRRVGFVSGLGVGAADISFAIIAGFGLTFIIDFIIEQQLIIQLVGASILLFLGIRLFTRNPAVEKRKQLKKYNTKLWSSFISMFLLTLSNPVGVFIHAGIFAGFGLVDNYTSINELFYLILGVALGAVCWWLFISSILSKFGNKISMRLLLWINKIAGITIMIFGVIIILSVFTDNNRFKMPDKSPKQQDYKTNN